MGSGPSTRNVVRIALAVAGAALALYLFYLIRSALQLILLAVFIAFWLGPFVEFLSRRRVSRVVAILAAYLTLFVSLVFLGLVVVPPIAAIIVGIVTLFYSFPTDTIIWAIVVIVYQQIENNVLSPIVYRRTVQVPGMLVLIAVLIGATLSGVIGALLAIPVAAAIQIVVRDGWQQHHDGISE